MTKYEKYSLVISSIALMFSLSGIAFTYWLEHQKIRFEEQKTRTLLRVFIQPNDTGFVQFTQGHEEFPVALRHSFFARISNIGAVATTITSINIGPMWDEEVKGSIPGQSEGVNYFDGARVIITKPVFYELNGKKILLPVELEPRKIKDFIFEIGIGIRDKTWRNLRDKFKLDTPVAIEKVRKAFDDIGISAFGHFVRDNSSRPRCYRKTGDFVNYRMFLVTEDGSAHTFDFNVFLGNSRSYWAKFC